MRFPKLWKLEITLQEKLVFQKRLIYFYFRIEFDVRDTESNDDLFDLYYKNTDLKLLLDILATSSGIAHSLRSISDGNWNQNKQTYYILAMI